MIQLEVIFVYPLIFYCRVLFINGEVNAVFLNKLIKSKSTRNLIDIKLNYNFVISILMEKLTWNN